MSKRSVHQQCDLTAAEWDCIDQQVKSFERGWRADDEARFERVLAQAGELRTQLLTELIHVDIEFMLRAGQPSSTQAYLGHFPELSQDSVAVANLVLHELKLRQLRQPDLTLSQMLANFPELAEAVRRAPATVPLSRSLKPADDVPHRYDQAWPTIPGYEFKQVLGRGGMGIVYLAFDTQLKREVAIKMLLKGALATRRELARFYREAEAVAALHHPQVLRIYHIGEQAGQPYIVLEFAAGGGLHRQLKGRPIDARQAAHIMRGLTQAVATAHAADIIHRDLKPANVLLDAEGLPKIADFGLAKRLSTDLNQTEDDLLICTPSYAAPERIFDADCPSTPSLDIYSLGAILFELLTGRPPFVGTSVFEVLEQVRCSDAITPRRLVSSVPRDLETICLKCLERDPGQRYATATELAQDLERFLNRQPVTARPISATARLFRWARRNPLLAASCCLSALLLLTITAASLAFASVLAKRSQTEKHLRTLAQHAHQSAFANERRARADAAAANEAVHFIEELFAATDVGRLTTDGLNFVPDQLLMDVSTRQIVELGISRLGDALRQQPLTRARVLSTIGTSALNIGMLAEARPLLSEALELYAATGHSRSLAAAEAQIRLGRIEAATDNLERAEDLFQRSTLLLEELGAGDSLQQAEIGIYMVWGGLTQKHREFVEDNLHFVQRSVEITTRQLGRLHPQTVLARTIATLANALVTDDRQTSLQAMQTLWEEVKEVPFSALIKAIVLDQMASLSQRLNRTPEATRYIEQSLEMLTRVIGDHDHPLMAGILSDAAWIAHSRGAIRAACDYQVRALRMHQRCLGEDGQTTQLRHQLVEWARLAGQFQLADEFRAEAAAIGRRPYEPPLDAPWLVNRQRYDAAAELLRINLQEYIEGAWTSMVEIRSFELAQVEVLRGDFAAALALYDDWQQMEPELPAKGALEDYYMLAWEGCLDACGATQLARERRAEVDAMLHRYQADTPRFHPDNWAAIYQICQRMASEPRYKEQLQRWHAGWLGRTFPTHVVMGGLEAALAEQHLRDGELATARELAAQAVGCVREALGPDATFTAQAELLRARIAVAEGDLEQGLILAEEVMARFEPQDPDERVVLWENSSTFVTLLLEAEQYSQAELFARQSFESTRSLGLYHPHFANAACDLASVLLAQGQSAAAQEVLEPVANRLRKHLPPGNPQRRQVDDLLGRLKASSMAQE